MDNPHNGAADRRAEGETIERGANGEMNVATLLASAGRLLPAEPVTVDGNGRDAAGLAAAIGAAAGRFLGGQALALDQDFFDHGGTSVAAVEFVAVLARELGIDLSLDDVLTDGRPGRLAQRWLAVPDDRADEDLPLIAADLARADSLPWVGPPEPSPPRRILLTGATGFLGSHLLLDLLRRSDAHVICLVRAAGEQEGTARLAETFARMALPWSGEVRRRVSVLPGDLGQPRLGLAGDWWDKLAAEVDSIVSVGAVVDFLRGYPSLRHTNVLGPLTLAELAATGQPKPLHHVSTIAVFNEIGVAAMGEDDPPADIDRLAAGYDKSKWTAETALRRARDHGLTVTLLRPGGIGGHTRTGAYNPRDLSTGFTSVFTRFRTVPPFRFLNVAPVDWVSQVAAAIVCEPGGWGRNYHLTGKPGTMADTVREMSLGGMNVRVLGWDEWRADVLARLAADPVPQLDFLTRVLQSPTALKLCEATLFGPAAASERTRAFVADHRLPAPARYDAQAQQKSFERLARDGLARLPHRDDPPYLWFSETIEGDVGRLGEPADSPCSLSLTLSIASMYQLVRERRVDIRGQLRCTLLHPGALEAAGDMWIRPHDGVPLRHGVRHPLLRYQLRLRDADGQAWWMEGHKFARARRDLSWQARALTVEFGRDGEPASLAGEVVVPSDSYVREQIDGIHVNPRLSDREQRAAKMTWLAWFGLQVGRGLLDPVLRAGADLLDLSRGTSDTERGR